MRRAIESREETCPVSGRSAHVVGLDLRLPGRALAVAVDRQGRLLGFATVGGETHFDHSDSSAPLSVAEAIALSRQALAALAARPKSLRVLVGSSLCQVGAWNGVGQPEAEQIAEALLDEGHAPITEPAAASMPINADTWWVAQGDEQPLASLASALAELTSSEPVFVVDQLLLGYRLAEGSAVAELDASGFSIAAHPSAAPPVIRFLPMTPGVDAAAIEIQRTLDMLGLSGRVDARGPRREDLLEALECRGVDARTVPLPFYDGEPRERRSPDATPLPAALEMAWHLASAEAAHLPMFRGARLERQWHSMLWARRVAMASLVATFLGLAFVAYGITAGRANRTQGQEIRNEMARVDEQVRQLRESADLAQAIRSLRSDLETSELPWPRLASTLARLTRNCPPSVGWLRLEIHDASFELEATAFGSEPRQALDLLRRILERSPGLLNVAWDEPAPGDRGDLRQVFRATLREAAPESRSQQAAQQVQTLQQAPIDPVDADAAKDREPA